MSIHPVRFSGPLPAIRLGCVSFVYQAGERLGRRLIPPTETARLYRITGDVMCTSPDVICFLGDDRAYNAIVVSAGVEICFHVGDRHATIAAIDDHEAAAEVITSLARSSVR